MASTPSAISNLVHGFLQRKKMVGPPSEYRVLQPIACKLGN